MLDDATMLPLATPGDGFSALLTPALVCRAYRCVCTEDTRYYLCGVHVEPHPLGGALLVATNGHALVALRDLHGFVAGEATVRLDPPFLKEAKRAARRFGASARIVVADGRAALFDELVTSSGGDPDAVDPMAAQWLADGARAVRDLTPQIDALQWRDVIVDGAFPNWRAVVPKAIVAKAARQTIRIDAKKLAIVAQAVAGDDGAAAGVKLVHGGEADPVIVLPYTQREENPCRAVGLLMPYGRRGWTVDIPEWFMPRAEKRPSPSPEMAEMVERIAATEEGTSHV